MPGAVPNHRKLNRSGLTHVPSPRWHGALIVALLATGLLWLFAYALADWGWQQQWGTWNFAIAFGIGLVFAFALRWWRNDPRRRFLGDETSTGI